ncbi:MAG: hypothetical protein AAGJ87_06810 [Pseudomonadota bacterium]
MTDLSPSARLRETLQTLRATRRAMLSFDYLDTLENEPPARRREAALKMLSVNSAIRKLENEELADIRDKLVAEEKALKAATKDMKAAVRKLKKVKQLLDATSKFLDVVGRIVTLII